MNPSRIPQAQPQIRFEDRISDDDFWGMVTQGPIISRMPQAQPHIRQDDEVLKGNDTISEEDFWEMVTQGVREEHLTSAIERGLPPLTIQELINLAHPSDELPHKALSLALKHQHPLKTIQILINAGIKPNHSDVCIAVEAKSSTEVVKLLIDSGADLSEDVMLRAIECQSSFEIIQLLIDRGIPCSSSCMAAAERLHGELSDQAFALIRTAHQKWLQENMIPEGSIKV